jgi:hypothetical protein
MSLFRASQLTFQSLVLLFGANQAQVVIQNLPPPAIVDVVWY